MNLKDYQEFTPTTAQYPKKFAREYLSTGIAAEGGEVAGVYAKYFRGDYTSTVLKEKLKKELGDVMWFVSQICKEEGFKMQEILDLNVEKLTKRVEEGTIKGDGDDR